MATMAVSLRNVPGTKAALGWAGGHTLVIDRAEGKAGGMGLGFNGGQMIAMAIGGCFCNDLRYTGEKLGIEVETIEVEVSIDLAGEPLIVTSATIAAKVTSSDPAADIDRLLKATMADSTVSNSVIRGFPVKLAVRS